MKGSKGASVGRIIELEIASIIAEGGWRKAPKNPAEFLAMRENISKFGLRNEIEVCKIDNDTFKIVSGQTRLMAFEENNKQAIEGGKYSGTKANIDTNAYKKWNLIPAKIVEPADVLTSLELTFSENAIRGDMNPMDESDLLVAMKNEYEKKYPETQRGKAKKKKDTEKVKERARSFVDYISKLTGRHRNSVYYSLDLQDLASEEQERIRSGKVRKSVAISQAKKNKEKKSSSQLNGNGNSDGVVNLGDSNRHENSDEEDQDGGGDPSDLGDNPDNKDIEFFITQVRAFGSAIKNLDLDLVAASEPEIRSRLTDILKKAKAKIEAALASIE